MAETLVLVAERRTVSGKGSARKLRASGFVPAVVYGHNRETHSLAVAHSELDKVLHRIARGSTVFDLTVDGQTVQALIREVQRHPTKKTVTHLDFYEIRAGESITLDVPITLEGAPEGVRNAGGVLEQFLRALEIEVLPRDIPEHVVVDVTNLGIGRSLHVSDLSVPNAKVLSDPHTTICTVVPPRVEEEPVPELAEEEAAEPELIRKAREGEEESEEGEEAED
jgi:large subunit ribosomal protein L25